MPAVLGLVLCIAAFWGILHAFAYRLRTRQRGLQRVSLDKLTASIQSVRFPGLESTLGPPLCLRFSYTPPAARSLATKPKRRPAVVGRWGQHCYSPGAWLALVAFLCLPIAFVNSLYRSIHPLAQGAASPVLDSHAAEKTILVPGLTLPLSEAPVMLLAGFISIVWHETGHALAASLEGTSVASYGAFIFVVLPGAHVSLPALDALSPDKRLRIIAAGIWHNVILAGLAFALLASGFVGVSSPLLKLAGFSDWNEQGVIVQRVKEASSLSGLLRPGTLITHLDDLELHDSRTHGHWDKHLRLASADDSTTSSNYDQLGWCVTAAQWEAAPSECCSTTSGGNATASAGKAQATMVCFEALLDRQSGACLDPSAILSLPRCTDRCSSSDHVCVHPSTQSQLLRITALDPGQPAFRSKVIFYQGDKSLLWEQVKVGSMLAPVWASQQLPFELETLWRYVYTTSTSLAIFNLLPLPRLDGNEILALLLDLQDGDETLPSARVSRAPVGLSLASGLARLGAARPLQWARRRARRATLVRSVHVVTTLALLATVATSVYGEARH